MSLRQAVILAGGQGTRLRERLGDLPKPLIDVAGTPLLERQILLLKRHGYQHILILVNYKAEQIEQYCRDHANWGLEITCVDDGTPSGTAGAVVNILEQLDDEFLVMYGDTMLDVDLSRFEAAHATHQGSAGTIFLHPNDHPHDSDLVDLDTAGFVTAFHPYPHPPERYLPNLVNAALYILRREALRPWLGRGRTGIFDFGKHLFPELVSRGGKLYGYNCTEYIKDCGTPSRLDKITKDLLTGKIERMSLKHQQPTVFIDRDGTLNVEVNHLSRTDQLQLIDGVEEAVRRLNQAGYRTCVVTNQPVVARGDCSLAELKNIHNKLETLLGHKGAFLDRIYVCPHHPDGGFAGEVAALKIPCSCRKPGLALIEQAQRELNADLSQSWFVGDSTVDTETAHRAGIRSVLVTTGHAGRDGKYPRTPDFTVPDFAAAVELILETFPQALQQVAPLLAKVQPGQLILLGGQQGNGTRNTVSLITWALQARGLHVKLLSVAEWRQAQPLQAHDATNQFEVRIVEGPEALSLVAENQPGVHRWVTTLAAHALQILPVTCHADG